MSDLFLKAVGITLRFEGGWVKDRDDAGGETNHGISSGAHPNEDIGAMTAEAATEIYRRAYWDAISGDALGEVAPKTAVSVFDFAVHSGVMRAAKALQGELGVNVDGIIGPASLFAAGYRASMHGDASLATVLNIARRAFLLRLAESRSTDRKFLRGWAKRVDDLEEALEID